jgi:hypothetical protein
MDDAAGHGDDEDDDEDEEDDGDDDGMEKLRKKALAITKRLGLVLVTSESIKKQTPSKLCTACATENTLSSPMCHSCGQRF